MEVIYVALEYVIIEFVIDSSGADSGFEDGTSVFILDPILLWIYWTEDDCLYSLSCTETGQGDYYLHHMVQNSVNGKHELLFLGI